MPRGQSNFAECITLDEVMPNDEIVRVKTGNGTIYDFCIINAEEGRVALHRMGGRDYKPECCTFFNRDGYGRVIISTYLPFFYRGSHGENVASPPPEKIEIIKDPVMVQDLRIKVGLQEVHKQ